MGTELPALARPDFEVRLRAAGGDVLSDAQIDALHLHYETLRRWNRRVSLVGRTATEALIERHYGESLAAGALLESRRGVLLDVGSGAGFPGFVLAVARPDIDVTLVEARERKWAFLKTVCRRAGLSTKCLNAKVGPDSADAMPERIDWITSRGVGFRGLGLETLLPRLTEGGSILYWAGATDPDLQEGLRVSREVRLPGSAHRRILEIDRDR